MNQNNIRVLIEGKVYPEDKLSQLFLDITHPAEAKVIWEKAGLNLESFQGRPAGQAIDSLIRTVQELRKNPEDFKELESEDGSFTTESTEMFLMEILMGAYNHPAIPMTIQ